LDFSQVIGKGLSFQRSELIFTLSKPGHEFFEELFHVPKRGEVALELVLSL
jgi:hypothetical protein